MNKLVREHINEKFVEDSDPIHDMGIGIVKKLKDEYLEYYNSRIYYNMHKITEADITPDMLLTYAMRYNAQKDLITIECILNLEIDKKTLGRNLISAVNKGIEYVKLFLNKGNITKADKGKAFVFATRHDKLDIADFLLENGADINANGGSAIRNAVYYNNTARAKWLLDRGADTSSYNYYCLQTALKRKNFELADIFVESYKEKRKKK